MGPLNSLKSGKNYLVVVVSWSGMEWSQKRSKNKNDAVVEWRGRFLMYGGWRKEL